ncbi:MAG: tRNA lysidine(34) synthetase TilS [Blastocatellia bacterium]|nr:tRNA lysidine(34) synthetase TilS [Blastocatellia bacterium]
MVVDPLWPKVARRLQRIKGFSHTTGLVVAVSGGPDSVTLLHLLATHRNKINPALSLYVGHLNHGLRGADATADADFVVEFSQQLGISAQVECRDISQLAVGEGKNWEAVARRERYGFLSQLARNVGVSLIATGHTLTDQAETVLLRLIRGAGMDALAGISSERRINIEKNQGEIIRVIRPLLDVTRSEVEGYLGRWHLPFRHDATNDDVTLTRNRLRKVIWPELTGLNPKVAAALARTAEQAQQDADFFATQTEAWLSQSSHQTEAGTWLPVAELDRLPKALQHRVLHQVAQQDEFPAVSYRHICQLAQVLLAVNAQAKEIILPGCRRVRRVGNFLLFERERSEA